VQTSCAMLLIGYMLYVTFYDVQDLGWKKGGGEEEVQELKFAPKSESPRSENP